MTEWLKRRGSSRVCSLAVFLLDQVSPVEVVALGGVDGRDADRVDRQGECLGLRAHRGCLVATVTQYGLDVARQGLRQRHGFAALLSDVPAIARVLGETPPQDRHQKRDS